MMRAAVDERGLSSLIAKDGETAASDAIADLNQEPDPQHERFDPLMSMHWHWSNIALENGGLYLMTMKEDGSEYCPMCEIVAHTSDFDAKQGIEKVADQMLQWCREQNLLPQVN